MKRLTLHTLFAAAALTAAAGGASAQTLKAEIPFTFHAGEALLAPGTYLVSLDRTMGSSVFMLRNADTGRGVMVDRGVEGDAAKAWRADGQPRLRFDCIGARCALREVWSGGDTRSHYLRAPKIAREEAARSAEIILTKAN